jgi:hypothetical protein
MPTFLPKLSNSWNISNTVSDMQPLVGMFTKLWKLTTGFVMYACPHGTAWLPQDEFSWNLKFWGIFKTLLRKFKFYVKSEMNNVNLKYLAELFLEYEMFHMKVVMTIKTYIAQSIFFPKSCCLWDNEKYGTDNNTAQKRRNLLAK